MISYKPLWKLLIERDMKKCELRDAAGLTNHAMYKLSRNEAVTTEIIAKICKALNVTPNDIIEIIDEK